MKIARTGRPQSPAGHKGQDLALAGADTSVPTNLEVRVGYVGAVTAPILAARAREIRMVDVDADKITRMNTGVGPVIESGLQLTEVSLECAGGPSLPTGEADPRLVVHDVTRNSVDVRAKVAW